MTADDAIAPNVTIKLRQSEANGDRTVFAELCEERGLKTATAIAKHIGMSDKTVALIVDRDRDPSGKFIAQALARWPRCSFRALFAVVDETTGEERR